MAYSDAEYRLDMGRIGADDEEYFDEEMDEDEKNEIRIYLRKKHKRVDHGASVPKCCDFPGLSQYTGSIGCSMCCMITFFIISAAIVYGAYNVDQLVPSDGHHPGTWVQTDCVATSIINDQKRCEAETSWYEAMLPGFEHDMTPCCEMNVTYTYQTVEGVSQNQTGSSLDFYDSSSACTALINGPSFNCYYKQAPPYDRVEHATKFQQEEDQVKALKDARLGLLIAGMGIGAFYVLLLLMAVTFFWAYICGCLPEFVDHCVVYTWRDCCGTAANVEKNAKEREKEENKPLREGDSIQLPDGTSRPADDYELVNPDDTREDLKKKYEAAKSILIGKQLRCIALSEDFYTEVKDWVEDHPKFRTKPREDGGPSYTEIYELLHELNMGMTKEEMDPDHHVLHMFQMNLANHLVFEFEKNDVEARQENIVKLCQAGDMKWEEAEEEIRQAFKLRFKVKANELQSMITDKESEKLAVQELVKMGCTWSTASRYITEASEGLHKDKAQVLGKRDYGIETIAINRNRRKKYIALKNWMELHLATLENNLKNDPLFMAQNSGAGKLLSITAVLAVANDDLECYNQFKSYISRLNMHYEDLRKRTDTYTEISNRWAVYLHLSNSATQVNTGKTKRHLREQVRHELISALAGLIDETVDFADRNEIHKLLHEMELVDIQTDEYVSRLEVNLKEIADCEQGNTEALKKNLADQKKVMARMDNVNKGLKKNTEQLNRIVRTQILLQRCSIVILVATGLATVFVLFGDQVGL